MKVIISAGGTGGHIYPAIAIINKLKKEEKKLDILYIGTHNRMEKDIIPKLGINYEPIEIYGFSKSDILRDFKNISLIFKAKKRCIEIMKEFKPDIVIGIGGYVTMPVLMAAKSLNIKCMIHEQNSIPGKTNKLASRGVDVACISIKSSLKYFSKAKKIAYTGNPCAENYLTANKIDKKTLGLTEDKKLLLIFNGSLGSQIMNNKFDELLSLIKDEDNFEVLYITGKNYYDDFIKDKTYSKNIKVISYLDNLSGLLPSVDLIISRAGAGTIAEIIGTKIPSIIIPSPYVANNHQYYNALDLQEKKVSKLIEEKDFDAYRLYDEIKLLLSKNNKDYNEMKTHLEKLNLKKASDLIYKEIKDLINE